MEWWQTFFDEDYLRIWGEFAPEERTEQEAEGLLEILDLQPGAKLLDAPCGYGRLSSALARRGLRVVGVDQSADLLAHAERSRGEIGQDSLRYLKQDLRQRLPEGGFDAAINVFSSLGYGSEDDDLAILTTLREAVRPGGLVFVESMHRDLMSILFSRNPRPAMRCADGTLVMEQPKFDPISGTVHNTWFWWGPRGPGQKSARMRIYAITELVRLMERAGLQLRSAFRGCSPEPFKAEGPDAGGRVGLLARRP